MADVQQLRGIERAFNRVVGFLFRKGMAPEYGHELTVVGRKSGRPHTTPVNLLRFEGKLYLVAPRGETQWVKNARVAGEVTLTRGARATRYPLRELPSGARPAILAAYLKTYASQVQRFFIVEAGSAPEAFVAVADRHPVFELSAG